jgi:hypothetical protein
VHRDLSSGWWCSCWPDLQLQRHLTSARVGDNVAVRIERSRDNVFTVTATSQELSALVAGARMALEAMRSAPEAPPEAIETLGRVLAEFDSARARLANEPRPGG